MWSKFKKLCREPWQPAVQWLTVFQEKNLWSRYMVCSLEWLFGQRIVFIWNTDIEVLLQLLLLPQRPDDVERKAQRVERMDFLYLWDISLSFFLNFAPHPGVTAWLTLLGALWQPLSLINMLGRNNSFDSVPGRTERMSQCYHLDYFSSILFILTFDSGLWFPALG